MINDEFYMDLVIKKAWEYQFLTYPNPAVACLILDKNGKILSCEAHKRAGFLHAEARAILFALFKIDSNIFLDFIKIHNSKFNTNFLSLQDLDDANAIFSYEFILNNHKNLLNQAKAYVSLEPCSHYGKTPPCANLLVKLGFQEVFVSCEDENLIASGGIQILNNAGIKFKLGVLEDDGKNLIKPFKIWQKESLGFFKLAISLNGNINGKISNHLSQIHSHNLRSIVDLLVIGGNTVRIDRPILDSRFSRYPRNPDVLVYSKKKDFDKEIDLFKISNRKVEISDKLKFANLVMYEGGQGLLNLVKQIPNLRYFLLYQNHKFENLSNVKTNLNLKILYTGSFDDNLYHWCEMID